MGEGKSGVSSFFSFSLSSSRRSLTLPLFFFSATPPRSQGLCGESGKERKL